MTAEPDNTAPDAIRILLTGALGVDNEFAQFLIVHGFTTIRAIADAPTGTIASIKGLNEDMEAELHARANKWLAEHQEKPIAPMYVAAAHSSNTPMRRGRGRPLKEKRKVTLAIRIDGETLSRLRATGSGWQTRAGQGLKVLLDEGRI